MKKSTAAFIIISGMIACSIVVTQCTSKPRQEQNQEEHDAMKKDSSQIAYACPMHPEVTGKEGEKCSKCGMKLEAVKTSDSTATHQNH
jgi:hypothetical protein